MPGILWLASYPKSGNTWVRAFLGNLLLDPEKPLAINKLSDFMLGDGFLVHYEQFTGRKAEELSEAEIWRLRPKIHEWFAHSRSDNVLVKTHNAVLKIDGQPLITPSATAGAVYIVRNPLDVAVSFAHHYQVTYDRAVELLCDRDYVLPPSGGQVTQYLSSWSDHVRSWTRAPGLPLHLMRYEDMQKQPAESFAALARFANLPEDREKLEKAIEFSNFEELAGQERQGSFKEARPDGKAKFFRAGRSGGWRDALTPAQAEQLVNVHRPVMTDLGYIDSEGALTV